MEQITFDGVQINKRVNHNKEKTAFERRFQKWCDKESEDETTSYGMCGFGEICDWCKDNSYGRPCVRALNAMLREKGRVLDYSRTDYDNIFTWGE